MIPDQVTGAPTLLIADDHTLLAEAVASAALRGGYSEARVASSVREIYQLLNSGWKPAVCLIELELIRPNDFEALEEIGSRAPEVPVVVMYRETDAKNSDLILRAFVQGAVGLVSKDRGVDSLMRVLEVVRQGEAAIPRSMALAVVEALRYGPPLMEQEVGLTERQRQVLALVARGLTDRQIARQLAISAPTVRSHLEAIFEKTHTANRTAAARWASLHLDEPGEPMPASGQRSRAPVVPNIPRK